MFPLGHCWYKFHSSRAGFSPSNATDNAVWSTQSWHEILLKLLERLQCGEWYYRSYVLPIALSAVSPILFIAVNTITNSAKQCAADGVEWLLFLNWVFWDVVYLLTSSGVMAMWPELALTSESGTNSEIYRGFYFGIMCAIAGELNHGAYVFNHSELMLL